MSIKSSPGLTGRLFGTSIFSGIVSFVVSTLAATSGFPVVARLSFVFGMVAIAVLIAIATTALIAQAVQYLRKPLH